MSHFIPSLLRFTTVYSSVLSGKDNNSHLFLEMVICVTNRHRLTTSRHENKTLPVDYGDSIVFFWKMALLTRRETCTLISLINVESTLTDFEKFHPPQKEIHPPRLLIILSYKTLF